MCRWFNFCYRWWLGCIVSMVLSALLAVPAVGHEEHAADEIATAAEHFIASLDDQQRESTLFPLDHQHRFDWHFVPRERKGVALKEMNSQQRHLTTALLASSLSSTGLVKASGIMSLEQVLREIEGPERRFVRDPDRYHVTIYGEPGSDETWGWRFEGHHLSLNFTIVDGRHISATPSMMGTNPAVVQQGPHKGLRILTEEETLARQLAKSLSSEQRSQGILSEKAPPDILTGNKREVSPLKPQGISWNDLQQDQQELLWTLVEIYVRRMRFEIADADLQKIKDTGKEKLHFAWAGGLEPGQGHYYRIQGPTFLIEYDNTQNNANHIHTVYRDFDEDFGEDLLKKHYEESHQ